MKKFFFLLSVSLFFLISCNTTTVSILDKNIKPKNDMGYIYGKFSMLRSYSANIDLVLTEVKTNYQYRIPLDDGTMFSKSNELRAFTIKPGQYKITHLTAVIPTKNGVRYQTNEFTKSPFSKSFTVEEGKKYYLGDFTGDSSPAGWGVRWQLKKIENNFSATTKEMDSVYANLKSLQPIQAFK